MHVYILYTRALDINYSILKYDFPANQYERRVLDNGPMINISTTENCSDVIFSIKMPGIFCQIFVINLMLLNKHRREYLIIIA